MRFPWIAAVGLSTACASILGVDHDYTLGGAAEDPGIRCADGGTYCPPSEQICCLQGSQGSQCMDTGPGLAPCMGYTSIRCDDSADCGDAGLTCCISLNQQAYLLETACYLACPATNSAGVPWASLCNPNGGSACPPGMTCQPLRVGNFDSQPGWFHSCQ
jgi:hypothetical protein